MAGNKDLEELKQDAEECKDLLAKATRKRLKDVLSIELLKIETKIKDLETSLNSSSSAALKPVKASANRIYNTVIRNYSWDQSTKFVKLYLTLKGVQNVNKENIICAFEKQSLSFKVLDLDGKNHEFAISYFAHSIVPEESHFKVKTDMIVIFAAKTVPSNWEAITFEERRALDVKKASKPEMSKDDPSSGLMGMMKQMYDDGDDEMKRMLNKTWYENQLKSQGAEPELDL